VTDNLTVDKFHRYRLYTHKYSIFVAGVSGDSAKRMLFKSTILFAWWRQLKLTGVFDADFAKDVRCTWITSRENHRCRSVAEQCLDNCWCSSAGSGAVPCRRCGRVSLNRFCFSFDISVMHNFPAFICSHLCHSVCNVSSDCILHMDWVLPKETYFAFWQLCWKWIFLIVVFGESGFLVTFLEFLSPFIPDLYILLCKTNPFHLVKFSLDILLVKFCVDIVVKFYMQSSSSLHDGHPDVVLSFLIVKFAKISKCLKEQKLICEYWSHQPEWLWLVKNFILVAEATIRGLTRLMQQGTVPNRCGPVKTGVTTAKKKEQAAWLASVLSHLFLEY